MFRAATSTDALRKGVPDEAARHFASRGPADVAEQRSAHARNTPEHRAGNSGLVIPKGLIPPSEYARTDL